MAELYVVTIEYFVHMKFSGHIENVDVQIFSSKEKAEEYLLNNGFVYGHSFFYYEPGWYHNDCIRPKSFGNIVNRLVSAKIAKMKVDEKQYCFSKCKKFINGEE